MCLYYNTGLSKSQLRFEKSLIFLTMKEKQSLFKITHRVHYSTLKLCSRHGQMNIIKKFLAFLERERVNIKKRGYMTMLGILIFFIAAAAIYLCLEDAQLKQGGKPLTQSPVMRFGCGFAIFLAIICIIHAYTSK